MLEKLLAERLPGKTVKVLNAGHWMSTFDQHLLVIKELVPRFEPHLVLHGVYGGHVITIDEHSWVTDSRGDIRQVKFVGFQNEVVVREDGALQRTNRLIESPPFKSRFLAKVLQRYYRWKQLRDVQISAVALLDPNDDSLDDAWRKTREAIRQSAMFLDETSIPWVMAWSTAS